MSEENKERSPVKDNKKPAHRKIRTPRATKAKREEKPQPVKDQKKIKTPYDLEVARKMINIAQSASDRNLKYNLSFLTVKKLITTTKCYYTGIEFEDEGALSRSFDRIDSNLGYVEGNVVACTVDFNGKKSNLTAEEIEILYDKIVRPTKNKTVK